MKCNVFCPINKLKLKEVIYIKNNNSTDKNFLKNITLISQIGLSMITPILLGVYIGQFIDKKVGTKGIFTIIFLLIGVGGGFVNLFKLTGGSKGKEK